MAIIQPVLKVEINPNDPVAEICAVIMSIVPYHPGQDEKILRAVQAAIDVRLAQITKGAETDGEPLREPSRKQ